MNEGEREPETARDAPLRTEGPAPRPSGNSGRPPALALAYWLVPPLLCLLLQWRGFTAWFRGDDFAWLGVGVSIQNFHDLLNALFAPQAQGTIRPWSERLFFMAGFHFFGLDALPFRLVVFATQFANLALVASIGARLTGRRAAGFWAAIFWAVNSALVEPLGWTCVYNQVMCGCFLLLAFWFLLRYVETGQRRYNVYQWVTFLLGFGALEVNVVYPALAAVYTFLCARRHFRRTLPLFLPSLAYLAVHNAVAPLRTAGDYGMHFDGSMLATLATYWTWSVGPVFRWNPISLPQWLLTGGVVLISAGLLFFLVRQLRKAGPHTALFCLAWYLLTLAPVLPLRDHMTEYYIYLPIIGICWFGGWAFAEAWSGHSLAARTAAAGLAALYACTVAPQTLAGADWNYQITVRVRDLVEGVASAHDQHPGKAILLEGVDTELFWNGFLDRPFRLIGLDHIYLAPGSERRITANPELGNVEEYILPADVTASALERDEVVVYDARGSRLYNITAAYAARPRDRRTPARVDAGSPLTAYLLGPEWYPVDGDHRWMPKRASLRMGAPMAAGQKLYLRGECPDQQLRNGPLVVSVTVDSVALAPATIHPGENEFELAFALPPATVGKPEMRVVVEAGRAIVPPSDPRELGLAFGVFEVR